MQIWLNTNIEVHHFIPEKYWKDNYSSVKEMIQQSEIYVFEDDITNQILGFIGLENNYIAGIFVEKAYRSKGIGKQLLDYVKKFKSILRLSVYQKNLQAIAFYHREQFTVQSENTDYSTNERELIMEWHKQVLS